MNEVRDCTFTNIDLLMLLEFKKERSQNIHIKEDGDTSICEIYKLRDTFVQLCTCQAQLCTHGYMDVLCVRESSPAMR